MIKTEIITMPNGNKLIHTWSDTHHRIIQDETNIIYDEAMDPINSGRTYIESDEIIEEVTINERDDEPQEL